MVQLVVKFLALVAGLTYSFTVFATAVIPVKGRVTSLTKTMAIVKGGKSEFRIDISKLNEADRKALEAAQAQKTAVELSLVVDQLAND